MRDFLLLFLLSCTLAGQTVTIRTRKGDSPPLEKSPGDSVELDPATQDIVAISNGMTIRFPTENLIQPELSAKLARDGRTLTYNYSLSNGTGANQSILFLTFECGYPAEVRLTAPAGWRSLTVSPQVNHARSLAFLQLAGDSQVPFIMAAGKSAGPFQLTSELHPGLIRAVVYALPLDRPSTELSKGEQLRFLSPWAYQKVTELDSTDRTLKYVLTVGPKIPPDHDSLSAIRMELAHASGQPEFAAMSAQLGALARSSTREQLLTQLKPLAKDALQASFVQALLWRLETLNE